jgi:hypothetical protein
MDGERFIFFMIKEENDEIVGFDLVMKKIMILLGF